MEQLSDRDLDYLIRHADKLDPAQQQHVLALLEAREKRAHIERARKRFTAFVEAVWPDFIAGAHHKLMAEKFEAVAEGRLKRLIIDMPPRHQLRIDTPIPTTDGWKTMAEVREGDFVFSPSGAPVRVTGKSPVQEADLYEVVTSDGQIVECDGEHLWAVSWNHKPFVTMSAAEIAHKLDAEAWRAHGNLPTLPPVAPVEYPERNLLVPPYVLGAWLGDGSATDGSMTTHPDDAAFMRARFEASGVPTTDVKAKMRFGTRHLRVKLRDIGVLHDKHIPQEYLTAHPAQRLALLQGLMDTDGTVSKDGKCTFHNSNLRLMQDVQELVHSFGLKTQITRRQTHYKHHVSQPSYRLSFKMAGAASLPRKAERTRAMEGNWARSIDVRKTGRRGAVQCLKVANDDGLFLAGRGYVVTHNTKSEFASWLLPAWFFGNFPKKKIIQVSNTEALAAGFGRRVRNLLDVTGDDGMTEESRAYHEIFPNTRLAADSKAAANWHTSSGGEYFAVGVNGKVTGKGADIAIVDDPHALEIHTPIPTPKGFVAVGDLQVGDEVFGPDGKTTKVVAKSDVAHDRELYAVQTDDKQTVLCDGGHLWTHRSDTKMSAPLRTTTTRELAAWSKSSKPCLPRYAAVEYPEADLPIDPWVLGAWLGDGTSSLGRMTAHPDDAPYIRAEFEKAGYETTNLTDPFSFGVPGLRAQLGGQGLLNNKHVPEKYLRASVAQRMALLQGLMDTDGNITEAGQCAFHNANKGMVADVVQLLHSLGVKAKMTEYPDKRANHQTRYRVTFKLKDAARMPRKAIRSFTPTDKRSRSIKVTATGETGDVQCITVDRPDGLFLAGYGYVVTHNSEQEARQAESTPEIFDGVYEWYTSGIRQRLQPGGSIIIVVTRWSKRDLVGQVLRSMETAIKSGVPEDQYDNWDVLSLPAIIDEHTPTERSMWPGFWPLEELQRTRNALPVAKWQAQYQQNPTSEGAAIIKRDSWRKWGALANEGRAKPDKCPGPMHLRAWNDNEPPACKFVIQSWDAAATAKDRSHPSAMTLWGVFDAEDPNTGKTLPNLILLSAFKDRMEFPALKRTAKTFYDEDKPDVLLIENKSAGMQLLQEFRSMGIPAESFAGSSRGTERMPNDKVARANMIADIFSSGYVWAPERRFAEEVIEQCASFPAGDEDDYVDSTVQALLRFRQGGLIRTANDQDEQEDAPRPRRRRYY